MREVIGYAVETVKNQANEKDVTIQVNVPEFIHFIKADKEKAAWVMVNLLSNAIRYSPENETIIIQIEAQSDNKIRITVTDKGPGIPAAYQDKIFQRFFTVPGNSKGSGLGLSISKEFMMAMGGSIQVESEPNKITIFTLLFNN